ncbi:MAG: cysteine hydrolase, partial [Armatimonadetes bacterium]|nr:cysteine hydrolase [Armatimonadota bacterium]
VATGLADRLAAAGTDTVVVCGLVTNVCVQATAEHAFELGYHVIVGADATASSTDATQRAWLDHLAAFYGRVLDAAAITNLWRSPA